MADVVQSITAFALERLGGGRNPDLMLTGALIRPAQPNNWNEMDKNKLFRRTCVIAVLCALNGAVLAESLPAALREAALKAVGTNPEVQARWHAFQAAGAEQDVARGGYLPQLDLDAAIGRERQDRPGQATDNYTHRGAALTLRQMLYDGFLTRSEVARLGYARLARYYEVVDASESAALETVRAYADVLRYRDLVQLAKDNYVEHRRVYDQIAERTAAGVGRRVDLEQASGRLALAESNLLTEVSNLHDVSARYLRLVGEAPGATLPALPDAIDKPLALDAKSPLRRFLMGAAARYLGTQWQDGKPLDPVARFHLGNGARVERLNWAGDPSAKGLKQSYGLMVNYLYDLKRLDRHRNQLAQGRIPMSSEVEDLLKP